MLVIAMMDGSDAAVGYAYGHAWEMERVRLAGLEAALDPGTRHLASAGAARPTEEVPPRIGTD